MLRSMYAAFAEREFGAELLLRGELLNLLALIVRELTTTGGKSLCPPRSERVGQAIRWMETHYRSPIQLHDIASSVHLSPSRFRELFKEETRNEAVHGEGWTEWELVRRATPRFPGHEQPKVPLWGYLDESKPETAERQIAHTAEYGIDTFIYDWYWYEDGPFLNRALEEGFLKASNNDPLKFSLMWANHDWINIFPYKRGMDHTLLHSGQVSLPAFEAASDYMIERYFCHPSYWRVNGGLR
ncbi:glycoside hydrolase family 99-like domain-containing protein [Paenibacillus sp. PAMC21692]|uniref:glycoside hydrolase family 99-like domain-containing protein n=1 Tax=Paenibacillus sp. PAMC21692 TaxID=2762320 RepID=UPI00164DB0F0|nr:glycoside hydrolase family 99-like domain-containing protein [Paenibacillus sp. PAMC21692]QNK57360.1 glycoside hydrolase family 99-like domain-containing protein [Paenibacillus sp. PAMC21692]